MVVVDLLMALPLAWPSPTARKSETPRPPTQLCVIQWVSVQRHPYTIGNVFCTSLQSVTLVPRRAINKEPYRVG